MRRCGRTHGIRLSRKPASTSLSARPRLTAPMRGFVPGLSLEPCIPPYWAGSGHAQTIWGHLLPSPTPGVRGDRVEVELPDGDCLVGMRFVGGDDRRVAYLFHGLGGTSDAD